MINEPKISFLTFYGIIACLLVLGFGCQKDVNLGVKPTKEETTKISVEELQVDCIKNKEKCTQIKKTETDGSYAVHEYKTPNGDTGYQTIFYDEGGRPIESIGYGVEAESRTWTRTYPIIIPTSTL